MRRAFENIFYVSCEEKTKITTRSWHYAGYNPQPDSIIDLLFNVKNQSDKALELQKWREQAYDEGYTEGTELGKGASDFLMLIRDAQEKQKQKQAQARAQAQAEQQSQAQARAQAQAWAQAQDKHSEQQAQAQRCRTGGAAGTGTDAGGAAVPAQPRTARIAATAYYPLTAGTSVPARAAV